MAEADRKDVTKVRMSRDRAERLATLAAQRGCTESEVIRDAIDLLELRERRVRAAEALIDMLGPDEDYTKEEIRLK